MLASSSTTQMMDGLSKGHHHDRFIMKKWAPRLGPFGCRRRSELPVRVKAAQTHAGAAQGVANNVNFPLELAAQHFLARHTGKNERSFHPGPAQLIQGIASRLLRRLQGRLIAPDLEPDFASLRYIACADERPGASDADRVAQQILRLSQHFRA